MFQIDDELLERLSRSRHIVILTGAGVSAESGVKTFRDPDGLWAKLNPAELASIDGFMSNPKVVWQWYKDRWELLKNIKPNPGHYAIAEMERIFPQVTLVTQNVDRLHQKAGSVNVIELHGNLEDNHCMDCREPFSWDMEPPQSDLPRCKYCNGIVRPSVVWFGEMLPVGAIEEAERAALLCDIFFCVGTSAEVYPAASLPYTARRNGAYLVEANPNTTALSRYANAWLEAPSGIALPLMLEEYKKYIEKIS